MTEWEWGVGKAAGRAAAAYRSFGFGFCLDFVWISDFGRPLNREKLIREAYSGEWSVCRFSLAVTSPPSPLSPATGDASLPPVPLRGRELIVEHGSTTHSIMCVVAIA